MDGNGPGRLSLIVTDLDGCLLDSRGRMPGDFMRVVDACEKAGIILCACSGRAVEGVTTPLGEAASHMALITDNGARIWMGGELRFVRTIPRNLWMRVVTEGRRHPGLVVILTTRWGAFTDAAMPYDAETERELVKFYPSWKVLDAASFDGDVIKVSLMYMNDIEKNILPYFMPLEDRGLDVKCTAYTWMDIGQKGISKGTGIADLQRLTGVGKAETAVFGDYLNDIPMAAVARWSFAPANSHPEVKKVFTYLIADHDTWSVSRAILALAEGRMPEASPAAALRRPAIHTADAFRGDPDRIRDGEEEEEGPERTYRDGGSVNECWHSGEW